MAGSSHRTRAMTSTTQSGGAMSRKYPADTAQQRFMEETYNKETSIRLGWYFSTKHSNTTEGNSRQMEVSRKRIEEACPRPTAYLLQLKDRFEAPADYRKKAFRIDGLPVQSHSRCNDEPGSSQNVIVHKVEPDMIPPESPVKEKLYDGCSHDGKGRIDYLKTRSKTMGPEERYKHPVTSSFDYGWKFSDVMDEPSKPRYGRATLVRDTFYARNGVNALPLPLSN